MGTGAVPSHHVEWQWVGRPAPLQRCFSNAGLGDGTRVSFAFGVAAPAVGATSTVGASAVTVQGDTLRIEGSNGVL